MDVLTQHNDNFRTGAVRLSGINAGVAALRRWTLLNELPVDGAVYAQPLYVEQTRAGDGVVRDLVVVATANNSVYAFDVHSYLCVWRCHLGEPDRSDQYPPFKLHPPLKGHACAFLSPGRLLRPGGRLSFRASQQDEVDYFIGIQATPVIDRGRRLVYVSYRVGGATYRRAQQRLAAIHLDSGAVANDVPIAQHREFRIESQRQRAGLLLLGGMIYVGFASRCEDPGVVPNYHGWVFVHDAKSLAELTSFNVTPTSAGGGIWQGAGGLAADEHGRVYMITGNIQDEVGVDMKPDPRGVNLGNSFVRLDPRVVRRADSSVASATVSVGSWFIPYRAEWQNTIDLDLGSAGPVVIPNTNLVAGGGKEGIVYLLDRENLGGFAAAPSGALPPKCPGQRFGYCAPHVANDPSRDHALSEVQAGVNSYLTVHGQFMNDWTRWPHIHGSPVYGDFGAGKRFLYVWPEKDYLKAISLDRQRLTIARRGPDRAPAGEKTKDGTILGGMPGGMLSLVIDSSNPGHGVLFASVPIEGFIKPQLHGSLHAYDPLTLKRVWTSRESSENAYWFAKFVSPTIVPAGLLLPTFSNKVLVYGELTMHRSPVSAINRSDLQEDIFAVGSNGVVYTNYVHGGEPWHGWIPLIDYSDAFPDHFTVPPGAPLAAVKRNQRQEDIFVVGRDGVAYTNYVLDDGAWHGWIGLAAPSARFPAGAPISALKRNDIQEDIFAVGQDGAIYTSYVLYDAPNKRWGPWHDWIRIRDTTNRFPDHFTVPPRTPIAAIKRDTHQLDIFVTGRDGVAYTNFVLDGDAWNPEWIALGAPPAGLPAGATITAIQRDPHQVDIFAIANDGRVYTSFVAIDQGTGRWGTWKPWIPLGSQTPRFTPGTSVAAVKRTDTSVDIFAVSENGAAHTSFITIDRATGRWGAWHDWIPLGSPPPGFAPGAPISAIKRNAIQEDIFATAIDGLVYTSYVLLQAGIWGAWKPWIPL